MRKVQVGSDLTKSNPSGAGNVVNYAAGKGTPGGNKGPKFPGFGSGGMAAEEAAESPATEHAEQRT